MTTPPPGRPNLPITVYMPTPANIPAYRDTATAERDICRRLRENQPLVYLDFESAERAALAAAPAAEEPDEWIGLLAIAYGCDPAALDLGVLKPPVHVSYVLEVEFDDDLTIAETDAVAKAAHLAFRAAHPEVDALWVPSDHSVLEGSCRLRIITCRDLTGHLSLVRSTRVPAKSRPLSFD